MVHSSVRCPPQINNKQQLLDGSSGPETHGCCTSHDTSEEHAQGGTASEPTMWVQLVLMLVIALPLQFDTVVPKVWLRNNGCIMYMCSCGYIGVRFCMLCCADAEHDFVPCRCRNPFSVNNFMVYAFIIMEAVINGFCIAIYNTEGGMLVLLASVVIFGALKAYACATKADFTGIGPYLLCALSVLTSFLFVLMLLGAFFGHGRFFPLYFVSASLFAILVLCYHVYTVQMMFGGPHANHRGWATQFIEI